MPFPTSRTSRCRSTPRSKRLAPEEIEKLVTYPLEMEMFGVPGMTELRSLSKFGLSQITLVFEEGTDIYRARQLVSERLQNAVDELPTGVSPKLAPITTGLGEIYYYVVDYAPGYESPDKPKNRAEQLMELKLIHDFVVKPQLRSVPGIAEVNASGGYEKQIVIQPNPEKLLASRRDVQRTRRHHRRERRERGRQRHSAWRRADRHSRERPRANSRGNWEPACEIPAPARSRCGLRIVADVEIGKTIRTGSATYNGEEAVLGAALMLAGENSRIVAKRVDERTPGDSGRSFRPGVEIQTGLRPHDARRSDHCALSQDNLFEGAVLVVAVLLFLLGNWRAALIVVTRPFRFRCSLPSPAWWRAAISGNLMSLGAIDFGLIIDGAVVMVENIVRHLGLRAARAGPAAHRQRTPARTCSSAAKEVGQPDVLRRVDHHRRLCPDPRAHRHRRKNVQADGAHRHLRARSGRSSSRSRSCRCSVPIC